MNPDTLKLIGAGLSLIEQVGEWIQEGLSDAEIRKRLAAPKGVAQDLIAASRTRKKKLDDFKKNG